VNVDVLTTYQTEHDLYRLGPDGDGGYVVCDIPCEYDHVISAGVGDTYQFEKELCERYNVPGILLDGTIPSTIVESINTHKLLTCRAHNLTTHGPESLQQLLEPYKNAFVKLDIEADEFMIFKQLNVDHLNKIAQLVVELHLGLLRHKKQPYTVKSRLNTLDTIRHTHVLVHVHGNNYPRPVYFPGTRVPRCIECTYIHKDYVDGLKLNTVPFPRTVDRPCNPRRVDVVMNSSPFVVD